jgi:hypothetical protein
MVFLFRYFWSKMPGMSFGIAMLLKPFALFAFLGLLVCVRYAVIWWFPECWLKRLLLRRI